MCVSLLRALRGSGRTAISWRTSSRAMRVLRRPSIPEEPAMARTTTAGGPTFLRFIIPIAETLKELGNSGTAREVTDRVIEKLKISDAELAATTSNGQSRVRNQI